jgi:6-phosphogluconolactonase
LHVEILNDPPAVAARVAALIGARLRRAVQERGKAALAISGGRTPMAMLSLLAREEVPWTETDVFQVDERVAPDGHPQRNATGLRQAFASLTEAHPKCFHWMPVTEPDLEEGAQQYAEELCTTVGRPPLFDVVHLGIGEDGHTASIFPGNAVVHATARKVMVTGVHLGWRRMTLTLPVLNRARMIVWVVTGRSKREVVTRLLQGDKSLVAAKVRRDDAWLIADSEAAEPNGA